MFYFKESNKSTMFHISKDLWNLIKIHSTCQTQILLRSCNKELSDIKITKLLSKKIKQMNHNVIAREIARNPNLRIFSIHNHIKGFRTTLLKKLPKHIHILKVHIYDRALYSFPFRSFQINRLYVTGTHNIYDKSTLLIGDEFQGIKHLSFEKWPLCFSDKTDTSLVELELINCVVFLKHGTNIFVNLKSLTLIDCSFGVGIWEITPDTLKCLQTLKLNKINTSKIPFLPKLKVLEIKKCPISSILSTNLETLTIEKNTVPLSIKNLDLKNLIIKECKYGIGYDFPKNLSFLKIVPYEKNLKNKQIDNMSPLIYIKQ